MFEQSKRIGQEGRNTRFTRKQEGPSRTLNHCLRALRRGDLATVLTARRSAERRALLAELIRLAGPELHLAAQIDAAQVGRSFSSHLVQLGLELAAPWEREPRWQGGLPVRRYLVVEQAEMLAPADLAGLADLRERSTGAEVQVLLAGSNHLLALLCGPIADRFWQRVKLAVTLEGPDYAAIDGDIARLEQEISRTRARLEAQKRILSIFADCPASAPGFDP